MADFCKQCAEEEGFPGSFDLAGLGRDRKLEPGTGWGALCEGCGPTLVDDDGRCLYHPPGGTGEDCMRAGDQHHAIEFEKIGA